MVESYGTPLVTNFSSSTFLNTSSKIHSYQPKPHPLEASAWSVYGFNEQISLGGF